MYANADGRHAPTVAILDTLSKQTQRRGKRAAMKAMTTTSPPASA
jgi:hypothetical protein